MLEILSKLPTLPFPLKAFLILTAGVVLLRIAGKRNLSEMTVAEAILRIAVGTVLISPLALKNEWEAVYGGTLLIVGIVLLTKIMQWFPAARDFIIGPPSILIKDGKFMMEEIKKARLTTDEIEVALRVKNIGNVSDVELCTLESSGKFSATLKPGKSPASKDDIQRIFDILAENGLSVPSNKQSSAKTSPLFKEAYDEGKKASFTPQDR